MAPHPAKLKILLVDEDPDRVLRMRAALEAAGCAVVASLSSAGDILASARDADPDVVIIETDSPSRDAVESLAFTASAHARPVVMFTDDTGSAGIRAAVGAGISAYIVDGLAPQRLGPILDLARQRFAADQSLKQELAASRRALTERKAIEKAKGVLMRARGLDEEAAHRMLRKFAMDRGLTLADAAARVLDMDPLLSSSA
ncbi:MAG: ANTAR domain-containing protein [Betaproteobacteria bacterium]|nr:ANTAR domain-containing protein [Betaproteobacteria bacterium]